MTRENLILNYQDSYNYIFSKKEIEAIDVEWKSTDESKYLMDEIPLIENEYTIKLDLPISIDLNFPFWSIYLNPHSSLNGIETEKDIRDIRFCKCETVKIINKSENNVLLRIKVKEILKADEHNKTKNEWFTLLNDKSFLNYVYVENFKEYSYLNLNIEGHTGINAIILKRNNKSYISIINRWDFKFDVWNLCSLELTKEQEINYKIKHLK